MLLFSGCDELYPHKEPVAVTQVFFTHKPCKSGKSESIISHESSAYHNIAEKRQVPVSQSEAVQTHKLINKAALEKMKTLFNIVHALGKNSRPMSDYLFQRRLHEANTGVSLGISYNSVTEANTFLSYVALDAFNKLAERLKKCTFMSITGDDSTDVSTTEQSIWFVRTVQDGNIHTDFLGNVALQKADASSIVHGLEEIIKSNLNSDLGQFGKKLVSATTDGASVMLGKNTGVGVQVQASTPGKEALLLHCMAHRLELSYKDTCKDVNLYQKGVLHLAMGLYYFYLRSPLNRANLRRASDLICCNVQAINVRETRGTYATPKIIF